MVVSKKVSIYIFISMLMLLSYAIFWIYYSDIATLHEINIMGVLCILSFVYIYMSWYQCGGTLFNGYIVFITAFYAFNLGQPMLLVFDYVDEPYNLLLPYNYKSLKETEYFNAAFMGLVFIIVMHIGALIALSNNLIKTGGDIQTPSNTQGKFLAIKKVSILILIISFPLWLYTTYQEISFTAIYGYGDDFFEEVKSQNTGIVKLIGDYYEPAVLSYYLSCEYFKKNRLFALLLIVSTLIVPPLMVGGRSQAVVSAIMMLIIYSLFHQIRWKRMLIICFGAYVMLNVVFLVKKTRGRSSTSLDTYMEILLDKENSPVSGALSEMGNSMYPMGATMDIVPKEEGFRYGTTYLWALTAIIPNIGFGDKHPSQKYANLGQWLMRVRQLPSGPGFSIVAEAYLNLGIFGFIFFLFLGYYMAKYCININSRDVLIKPFLVIGTLIFLWFSIKTVRNSFVGMVRAFFYYALLLSFLYRYYYLKHYSNNEDS